MSRLSRDLTLVAWKGRTLMCWLEDCQGWEPYRGKSASEALDTRKRKSNWHLSRGPETLQVRSCGVSPRETFRPVMLLESLGEILALGLPRLLFGLANSGVTVPKKPGAHVTLDRLKSEGETFWPTELPLTGSVSSSRSLL